MSSGDGGIWGGCGVAKTGDLDSGCLPRFLMRGRRSSVELLSENIQNGWGLPCEDMDLGSRQLMTHHLKISSARWIKFHRLIQLELLFPVLGGWVTNLWSKYDR